MTLREVIRLGVGMKQSVFCQLQSQTVTMLWSSYRKQINSHHCIDATFVEQLLEMTFVEHYSQIGCGELLDCEENHARVSTPLHLHAGDHNYTQRSADC